MNILNQAKQTIKYWWLFLVLGLSMIAGGIYVMTTPLESYITLSLFFSIMVFANGIFNIIFAITNRQILKGWGWYFAGGILQIFLGYVLMNHPGITMIILPLILGFWLMFGAVSIISGAFDLKSYYIKGWGWVLLLGILLMIFSFIVISDPIFGGGTIVIFTGLAIISYGASYVFFGLQLKKVKEFAGDVKKAVSDSLDDLKKQVLTSIEEAKENKLTLEEVKEKFESFKNSLDQTE